MRLKEAKGFEARGLAEGLMQLDENYRYFARTITYEGMPQVWVLYESAHAKKRALKVAKKKILRPKLSDSGNNKARD